MKFIIRRVPFWMMVVVVAASLSMEIRTGLAAPLTVVEIASPRQEESTPGDNTGIDAATGVEIQRRFNELRREILDDRADAVGWWLSGIALFVTVMVLLIATAGFFGLRKLREVEEEARRNVDLARAHAEEAFKFVEEIRSYGGDTDEQLRNMPSAVMAFPRTQIGEDFSREPGRAGASAIADARHLEEEGRLDEAIVRWRHIASVAEGTNDELAALAFRSIGDLSERLSRSINS